MVWLPAACPPARWIDRSIDPCVVHLIQLTYPINHPTRTVDRSIPFLLKPKNLDGYVGDVGFDPLGLAESFDIRWMREAELKNGAHGGLLRAWVCLGWRWSIELCSHAHQPITPPPSLMNRTGRVAMLAFLGFIVQEFVRLPGDLYSEPNGVKAFFQVRP